LIGALGQAEALRELGRYAYAEAVVTEASERFPGNEWLTISLAHTAMAAGAWDEALRRWETAMQRFSHNPMIHGGMAETLTELERFDAAKAVLDRAAKRFPPDAAALYPIETAADAVKAGSALITAVSNGDVTPLEAAELGKLVETYVKSVRLPTSKCGFLAWNRQMRRPSDSESEPQRLCELSKGG
jgi:tetratricopeptide (TPR) repeat protein